MNLKHLLIILICISFKTIFSQGKDDFKGMALIKGGEYLPLYSSDSQKVFVKSFYMDIYPVTNVDYLAFIKSNSTWAKSKIKRLFADSLYLKHWVADTLFNMNIAKSPVVNVSWFAAKKYCECQGKRLPTNAEWEIVAKSNQTHADASKSKEFNQWVLNWVTKHSPAILPNVGSTFKNYYGVYDMHGLVWEWTYDFNNALTTGESRGNSSLDNTFFCGGGSFGSKDLNNYASFMRFAMRSSVKAKYSVQNLGFRCVKTKK
jgi:sulfatase modifying factor 1